MQSDYEGRPAGELAAMLVDSSGMQRILIRRELADRCLRAGDWEDAAEHFHAAGEEALTLGDQSTAGEVFTQLGAARFNARAWEDSVAAYRRSAECFAAAGRTWQRARALWGAGDALMELGRFADCLSQTDGLTGKNDEGPADLVGRIALQRAHALYELERTDESLAEATRARDAFRHGGLAAEVARADDLALSICLGRGELDRALELATNCYVIALATADHIDEAAAELRLAETHLERDEPDDALHYAKQARDRFAAADDTAGIARADMLRGWSLTQQDRLVDAERAFADARVLFDATGADDSALMCQVQRARILHALDRFPKAAALNETLVSAYGAAGRSVPQGWAVVRQAENHLEGGDPRGALAIAAEWLQGVGDAAPDSPAEASPAEASPNADSPNADSPDPGSPAADSPAADSPDREGSGNDAADELRAVRANVLAVKARALANLGDEGNAVQSAEEVLALTDEDHFNHNTAWMYDILAAALMRDGGDEARRVLAHAIALHLAVGSTARARDLSRHFLPQRQQGSGTRDGGNQPRRDPDAGLGGYL